MINFLQAFILGLVQGVTEFLPISSSAHLLLVPQLFGWPDHPLAFDAVLHLGTGLAGFYFFAEEWQRLRRSFTSDWVNFGPRFGRFSTDAKRLLFIVVAMIPAGVVGFLFDDFVEANLRSAGIVALALAGVALVMILADRLATEAKTEVGLRDAVAIGFSQVLALVPGVSRSGITMTAGLLRGLTLEEAARFSFLVATPLVFVAGVWGLFSSFSFNVDLLVLAAGFSASLLAGFLAMGFFLKTAKQWGLVPFAIYRLLIALLVVLFLG